MPSVLDDLLSRKPETRTVKIPLDPDLAQEFLDAKREVRKLEDRLESRRRTAERFPDDGAIATSVEEVQDQLVAAEERVDELKEQVAKAQAVFVFGSISEQEFDEIKGRKECQPTAAQIQEAKKLTGKRPTWNQQTMEPIMVAASCLKVTTPSGSQEGLSEEQVHELWKTPAWNVGARQLLVSAAFEAYWSYTNPEGDPDPKDSGVTPSSLANLLTALQQVSPTASS